MQLLEYYFWISLSFVIYIYFGYPTATAFLANFYSRTVKKGSYEPTVSILIAAYNEEKTIRRTIENKLSLQYPREKLEVIIVSDASTDQTDKIVSEILLENVRFIRRERREGKTA